MNKDRYSRVKTCISTSTLTCTTPGTTEKERERGGPSYAHNEDPETSIQAPI